MSRFTTRRDGTRNASSKQKAKDRRRVRTMKYADQKGA